MFRSIHSVMFFVDDPSAALKWYSRLLQVNVMTVAPDFCALLHRGPLKIENGQQICQYRDPFGNLFGVAASIEDTANPRFDS